MKYICQTLKCFVSVKSVCKKRVIFGLLFPILERLMYSSCVRVYILIFPSLTQ